MARFVVIKVVCAGFMVCCDEEQFHCKNITAKDLLDGQGEADAFDNKEFVKLHQSTLRKVDVFCNFLGRTLDGSLITKATWWEMDGGSVKP